MIFCEYILLFHFERQHGFTPISDPISEHDESYWGRAFNYKNINKQTLKTRIYKDTNLLNNFVWHESDCRQIVRDVVAYNNVVHNSVVVDTSMAEEEYDTVSRQVEIEA